MENIDIVENIDKIAKQERNKYYREYRKKNSEKYKEYQTRYWAKKSKDLCCEENQENKSNSNRFKE